MLFKHESVINKLYTMNAKTVLNKIKAELGMEVKLMQAKLDNGTTIEAESWEEGEPVFIVTEDERVPLPEGEYMTEDGTAIMVAEEGIIASVGAPASEEEEAKSEEEEMAKEEESKEELAEEPQYVTKEMLDAAINSIVEKLSAQPKEEVKEEAKEEAKEEKQELSKDMPAAKAIKANPEREAEKKSLHLYSQNRTRGIADSVASKIYSIKNKK